MLLSLALSALALVPQAPVTAEAPKRPTLVLAGLEAPPPLAPMGLAERIAQARRRAAPPPVAVPTAREEARVAEMFPDRPADGLGSAGRRSALGLRPSNTVLRDERLGSSGRRAVLSSPPVYRTRTRR